MSGISSRLHGLPMCSSFFSYHLIERMKLLDAWMCLFFWGCDASFLKTTGSTAVAGCHSSELNFWANLHVKRLVKDWTLPHICIDTYIHIYIHCIYCVYIYTTYMYIYMLYVTKFSSLGKALTYHSVDEERRHSGFVCWDDLNFWKLFCDAQ